MEFWVLLAFILALLPIVGFVISLRNSRRIRAIEEDRATLHSSLERLTRQFSSLERELRTLRAGLQSSTAPVPESAPAPVAPAIPPVKIADPKPVVPSPPIRVPIAISRQEPPP